MPCAASQPMARLGDSPARGLGLVRSFEALNSSSFPVGMSQHWVPHHQHSGRAAWHSHQTVLQSAGRLFFFLFLRYLGQLDESFIQNSSFKELVFADRKSHTSVTLLTSPAAPKLTRLSPPEHSSVMDRPNTSEFHLLS